MPIHYPRLDTILNVERVIREADEPLSKNGIDRRLDKQIMRPTLNVILDYLEASGKIARLKEGIIWIFADDASEMLRARLERSIQVEELAQQSELTREDVERFSKKVKLLAGLRTRNT